MNIEAFRSESKFFNKSLSKEIRKNQGIFFTPYDARNKIFEKINELNIIPKTIMEPSFGSGEFLMDLIERYTHPMEIYGIEFNKDLYDKASQHSKFTQIHLTHDNFLNYHQQQNSIELIIGNPPYFVVKDKDPRCMTGRGNIFVQFIYKCIDEHLCDGGILAFVLPTSFYNCSYYEPCRRFIKEHTSILHLETIHVNYYDTNQDTMILILKKEVSNSHAYIFDYKSQIYLSPYANDLSQLVQNTKTLKELGFQVKTGSVVWNQHKNKLTNETGTLLIYSNNIVNGELVLHILKNDKKQYIQGFTQEPINGHAILVSRGYGNKFAFNFVYLNMDIPFYGENHVNIITPLNEDAIPYIERILLSFTNDKTLQFIKWFVGNGALSKSELENGLPIFMSDA